ncbi:class I SAM-dependent RNA methyltransferase [Corynebacterium sp. CCUG 51687]|uniref:class I SAM-dependent RNA methyltransferase n=1 Tax=Corynebacterium sp. CCUG 51687 TaxID=2823897 RepID=UPI00210CF388|nr:TRAM domain-containing protein [Corynebacterium sp. CCUG 51687]MCQ4611164.1 class I SAM-dependent RNA methyltransferase [Corynebacterium sp. CCUG 51687]
MSAQPSLTPGDSIQVTFHAFAHGGEAIALANDGRVVFVQGALPGETATVKLLKVKKRWARGELLEIQQTSPDRVKVGCPAAAAGAGCCDFAHMSESLQRAAKTEVLVGQLEKMARPSGVPDGIDLTAISVQALAPTTGWRTRIRLGTDAQGRAGFRKARSNDVVAERCTQAMPELFDGIVGDGARRFTPGSEIVVVIDSLGNRHVVETSKVQRGRRVERIDRTVEGSGNIVEMVGNDRFEFPATAFWQAHRSAPSAYADLVREWSLAGRPYQNNSGWDLYGGVGLFVPSMSAALGGGPVATVDYSKSAMAHSQPALASLDVNKVNSRVETGIRSLPPAGLVVLDPPRTGAGDKVIHDIAAASPQRVIHIGCDPATFARDLASWGACGYHVTEIKVIDAFPGTHHFETLACLEPLRPH